MEVEILVAVAHRQLHGALRDTEGEVQLGVHTAEVLAGLGGARRGKDGGIDHVVDAAGTGDLDGGHVTADADGGRGHAQRHSLRLVLVLDNHIGHEGVLLHLHTRRRVLQGDDQHAVALRLRGVLRRQDQVLHLLVGGEGQGVLRAGELVLQRDSLLLGRLLLGRLLLFGLLLGGNLLLSGGAGPVGDHAGELVASRLQGVIHLGQRRRGRFLDFLRGFLLGFLRRLRRGVLRRLRRHAAHHRVVHGNVRAALVVDDLGQLVVRVFVEVLHVVAAVHHGVHHGDVAVAREGLHILAKNLRRVVHAEVRGHVHQLQRDLGLLTQIAGASDGNVQFLIALLADGIVALGEEEEIPSLQFLRSCDRLRQRGLLLFCRQSGHQRGVKHHGQ